MADEAGRSQVDTNVAVVRRFYDEVFNQDRQDVVHEIIAPDYVDYGHDPPGRGPQGALDDLHGVRSFSDDSRYEIDDMVADGDTVAVRWTGRLIHTGAFAGFAPTGDELTLTGMSFYKLRDGRIVETRNQADLAGFMAQLGAALAG